MSQSTITIHHAWSEILRPGPEADGTFLAPCEGATLNEDAIRGIARHLVQAMTHPNRISDIPAPSDGNLLGQYALDVVRGALVATTNKPRQRRTRGVALVEPRRFVPDWSSLSAVDAILLVWGMDRQSRAHLRVARRLVGTDWLASNSTMPFGLACWPDHWPHSGDPYSPSLAHDPTLWRVLYPELVPAARGHDFQNRELLYAALDEPGDPLHWDALGDAVEEQELDPSRERFASRLLRKMILPGGAQVAPGLVHREEDR